MIPWEIRATSFTNCNCDWGCPCQFNAAPTHGQCEAVAAMHIDEGYFGDTRLDGLSTMLMAWWPGAIHEGGGRAFPIVDERADESQRQALLTILSGQETEPGATLWNVFSATFEEVIEPVFKPVEIEIDIEARTARARVEGIAELSGEPIRNPVTGEEHHAQIHLRDGFEYLVAEMGSGTSKTSGPIPLELESSYGQFNTIHLNNAGQVRR